MNERGNDRWADAKQDTPEDIAEANIVLPDFTNWTDDQLEMLGYTRDIFTTSIIEVEYEEDNEDDND